MSNELNDLMTRRAERGEHRGADTVLSRAQRELDPTQGRIAPATRRRLAGWIPAAAAAAVAVVAIGGVVLLATPDDPAPTTNSPVAATTTVPATTTLPPTTNTPGTAATTTAPTTTLPAQIDPIDWSRQALSGEGVVNSVVAGGPGLVAIGSAGDGIAIWTSSDADRWSRIPADDELFGGDGRMEMQDIASGPDGLVIIGSNSVGAERHPTTWFSPDGLVWERFDLDNEELGLDGPVFLNAITYGTAGYVAVGWTTPIDEPWMLDDHVVLHSEDGRTWSSASGLDELPLGGMWDVTAGGPGYVAVGVDWSTTGVAHAGVWVSSDANAWQLVDPAGVECDICDDIEQMNVVAAIGDDLFATGEGSLVWTSTDGINWQIIGRHHPEFDDGNYAEGIVGTSDRILAVGALEFNAGPEPDRAAAWVSKDGGFTWEASMLPDDVFGGAGGTMAMHDVIQIDEGYVAVGVWNGSPTVWVGVWEEEIGS